MRDLSKLRARLKPLIRGAGGATVLVAGLSASCSIGTTSGNLVAPDVQQVEDAKTDSAVSGNLIAPDVDTVDNTDTGGGDTGASDTSTKDGGSKDAAEKDTASKDTASKDTQADPDTLVSGNLLPPDIDTVSQDDSSK